MNRILVIIPSFQPLRGRPDFQYLGRKFLRSFGDLKDGRFHAAYVHLGPRKGIGLEVAREGNIEVHRLGLSTGLYVADLLLNLIFEAVYIPKLLAGNKCLLLCPAPYLGLIPSLFKRLFGVPLCVRVMGDTPGSLREIYHARLAGFLLLCIERLALRSADLVVANAEFTRNLAIRRGARRERIVMVPSPVMDFPEMVDEGRVADLRRKLGSDEVVLCVARLRQEKGVHHLIRAFPRILERHPEARLVLVGDGGLRVDLERLCDGLGIRGKVFFEGTVAHREVFSYYYAASVVALPSLSEGLALALVEAGLCRRPVVASRIAGNGEVVVDGKTGFLVAPGDEAALAHRIEKLLDNRKLGDRMGAEGCRRARAHQAGRERALNEVRRRLLDLLSL